MRTTKYQGCASSPLTILPRLFCYIHNSKGLDASPSEEKSQLTKLRHHARLQARAILKTPEANNLIIDRVLAEGKPFVEIGRTARSEKVDLIVMGSYGGQTSDVGRIFFGSTAEQVVRTASCPVLCVPFPYAKPSSPRPARRRSS